MRFYGSLWFNKVFGLSTGDSTFYAVLIPVIPIFYGSDSMRFYGSLRFNKAFGLSTGDSTLYAVPIPGIPICLWFRFYVVLRFVAVQ